MRLVNVLTGHLEEYHGESIPPYAILSHTWGRQELRFQDLPITEDAEAVSTSGIAACQTLQIYSWNTVLRSATTRGFSRYHENHVQSKVGYKKLLMAATQALQDGWGYLWLDTCCIDKASSAELTESINSMYSWYKDAKVCYAFLEDVSNMENFKSSRWFTRGWTLQELLAPQTVLFYNSMWRLIGEKASLLDTISQITRINRNVLRDRSEIMNICVAQRLSWAARRKTTRIEDMAYCLLGLLDCNIPLLYGEGTNAFQRLQEEFIRNHNDQSILAWGIEERVVEPPAPMAYSRIFALANAPSSFANCSTLTAIGPPLTSRPISVTQGIVRVELNSRRPIGAAYHEVVLACRTEDCDWNECLSILLSEDKAQDRFRRYARNGSATLRMKLDTALNPKQFAVMDEPDRPFVSHLWSIDVKGLLPPDDPPQTQIKGSIHVLNSSGSKKKGLYLIILRTCYTTPAT